MNSDFRVVGNSIFGSNNNYPNFRKESYYDDKFKHSVF